MKTADWGSNARVLNKKYGQKTNQKLLIILVALQAF